MTLMTRHLLLIPRDGFFAKDGRGWQTSVSGRGHGLSWPWPSTVLGSLRTLWGRGEEGRTHTTFQRKDWIERTQPIELGQTLVLRRRHGRNWTVDGTTWPVPLDALSLEGRDTFHRLDPEPPKAPTLGRDDDETREALWRPVLPTAQKPRRPPEWWSANDFVSWLSGKSVQAPPADASDNHGKAIALTRRLQAHVSIGPENGTAREGQLYSHDVVETLGPTEEWALGVEVRLPEGDLPSVATLGSDSRLARVEPLDDSLFQIPPALLEAFRAPCTGLRLVAVTPLYFTNGWLPDGFSAKDGICRGYLEGLDCELILRAAFVPRPMAISGWDMARGRRGRPKPTARMVPPGAVYFFERADNQPIGEAEARRLWLSAHGQRTAEGYGRVAPGIWNPNRSSS